MAGSGFFVEPLHIPLFADLQRRADIDLDKAFFPNKFAGHLPLPLERGDKCRHDNKTGIHHQFGYFGNAADILHAVGVGEAEVFVEALANVVAVQDISAIAACMQLHFQSVSQRRFTRAGEAGKPDHLALVAVVFFAILAGQAECLAVHVLGAAQAVVEHADGDCGFALAVHQGKAAQCFGLSEGVKCNGFAGGQIAQADVVKLKLGYGFMGQAVDVDAVFDAGERGG